MPSLAGPQHGVDLAFHDVEVPEGASGTVMADQTMLDLLDYGSGHVAKLGTFTSQKHVEVRRAMRKGLAASQIEPSR